MSSLVGKGRAGGFLKVGGGVPAFTLGPAPLMTSWGPLWSTSISPPVTSAALALALGPGVRCATAPARASTALREGEMAMIECINCQTLLFTRKETATNLSGVVRPGPVL
jgi:hypothetical protein